MVLICCNECIHSFHLWQENYLHAHINMCLQREAVPHDDLNTACSDGYHGNMTSGGKGQVKVIVPYPQAGYWFVALRMSCYKTLNERYFMISLLKLS